ncbi:hypothetical protein [Actinopolyspora halophila]|uniref:hypothetical protein n=1 Tax=Actinopolyspora halophila TaxID=1850 RepID=UPI00036CFC6B|nr:hypothetical protein [Actinopolyspora halophila]
MSLLTTATATGRHNRGTDAVAGAGPNRLGRQVWALGTVYGPRASAELAAEITRRAAEEASRTGAIEAVLLAARCVPTVPVEMAQDHRRDVDAWVTVVQTCPDRPAEGYDVAWAGDCRASHLTEHGQWQQVAGTWHRTRCEQHPDTRTPSLGGVVCSDDVGSRQVPIPYTRLVLTSPGVHSTLTYNELEMFGREHSPWDAAQRLVTAASQLGGQESTAVVVARAHG